MLNMLNMAIVKDLKEFIKSKTVSSVDEMVEDLSVIGVTKTTERKRKTLNIGNTIKVWTMVYGESFFGSCKICEETEIHLEDRQSWEISHLVPFSKGGNEELENLRPLCRSCNRKMKNMPLVEYCKKHYPQTYPKILHALKIEV